MKKISFKWLLFLAPIFSVCGSPFEKEMDLCKRGGGCFSFDQEEDTDFFAFVSFSMPEEAWLEMSKGLEKNGGTFVLQGLPNNSFQDFLKKIFDYRKKGILAPITVDPDAFKEYQISAVPSFVLEQPKGYRKIVGNVTVDYALKTLREENF